MALSAFQNPSDPERDNAIRKASEQVRAAVPLASADPDCPGYHYRSPAQWMNDPNGPIFYNGWYHMFYQLTPDSDQSGVKFWGHARSRDLVRWEEMPIALWPSTSRGEDSIWSGSVFPGANGKPIAWYTSIGKREPEQWMATTQDENLALWSKDAARLTQAAHQGKTIAEWRDPFLFDDFGLTYMITGGGLEGKGIVALYKATSTDLRQWQYLGVMFTHPDADVRNIECPNLALIDGKWVLLVSVHGRVEAFVGELQNTHFVSQSRSVLAEGSYASQVFQGVKGRTIHSAWVPTSDHRGWNGYLTLPSELHVSKNGELLRTPVKELTKLRGKKTSLGGKEVDGTLSLPIGRSLEIEATIDSGSARRLEFRLGSGAFKVVYDPSTRRLSVGDRSALLPSSKLLKLHLYLDRCALDVYAGDGSVSMVSQVHRLEGDEASLLVEGGKANVKELSVYELHP